MSIGRTRGACFCLPSTFNAVSRNHIKDTPTDNIGHLGPRPRCDFGRLLLRSFSMLSVISIGSASSSSWGLLSEVCVSHPSASMAAFFSASCLLFFSLPTNCIPLNSTRALNSLVFSVSSCTLVNCDLLLWVRSGASSLGLSHSSQFCSCYRCCNCWSWPSWFHGQSDDTWPASIRYFPCVCQHWDLE